MTKSEIREKYIGLRKSISSEALDNASLEIANRFLELPVWQLQYFHVFLPIISKQEVDTEYLLTILQGKDKEIVLSKSDFTSGGMHHFLLTDST
ncbi:MAG: 5-formyltetrahydrofolate cyclo-ligase, partial [Chitinophagaceae bacterium]